MQSKTFFLRKLAVAIVAAYPMFSVASPASGSAYFTDAQSSHVEDATSQGISQVNMITCFMGAMRPDALVNLGNYIALVDKTKCDPNSRSSTSNSGSTNSGSSSAADYMTATINSTRTSNTDPMRAKVWVDETDNGQSSLIFINISASEAPSTTNPYGVFRMDFCGKASPGLSGACMFNGYLEGSTSGMTFYQNESGGGGGGGGGGGTNTTALKLTTSGTTSGSGKLLMDRGGSSSSYTFAYNDTLFLRSDGTTDTCFSRDASDPETGMSVWRYGLYNATTGNRVTLDSGFPIDYTTGGQTYHGFLGYWGLSLPSGITLSNGATVQKVDYNSGQSPTTIDYTVTRADGRLTKYTKKTRTLHAMDKIKFTAWVGDATGLWTGGPSPDSNTQYEMYWDDGTSGFKATGKMACGSNGCQTQDLDAEHAVDPTFFSSFGGISGWSQSLGGELFIPISGAIADSNAVNVIYREQDLVYPADIPSTLYCLNNCPTVATMASYFAPSSSDQSPYGTSFNNWSPTSSGNVVQYTADLSAGVLNDNTASAITFTDQEALSEKPQYQWGVQTGRLFTDLAATECASSSGTYCDYKVNDANVYYVWQTGPNNWNQFAAVKDSGGNFVRFDAPLQVTYNVPNNSAIYGQYAGQSIVLQYGGFGELWGIPGACVSFKTNLPVSCDSNEARYVPSFVIPDDETTGLVTAGSTTYLVKWLDREIRFAKKATSVCTSASLTVPSGITLPTSASLKDPSNSSSDIYIGSKPAVTDAPRVIQGDVKY
ncbi:MAG: hypothetical protein V4568_07365 [Pseudomonadota bacterium]